MKLAGRLMEFRERKNTQQIHNDESISRDVKNEGNTKISYCFPTQLMVYEKRNASGGRDKKET